MDNLATESIEETQDDAELEQPTEELEVGEEAETEEETAEQSETDDDTTETEDDVAELLNLDGEEVDLETVRKWKNGHLMQEDYTRKTQALADERKTLKTKADELDGVVSELEQDLLADFDAEKLAELRDFDPSEYLKQVEKRDKRKNAIAEARSRAAKARDEFEAKHAEEQRSQLLKMNPEWLDAQGNTTEKYQADVDAINKYLAEQGVKQEQFGAISDAWVLNAIKEAAKAKQARAKAQQTAATKKTKKAPTVTKPQSKTAPAKQKSAAELMYGD